MPLYPSKDLFPSDDLYPSGDVAPAPAGPPHVDGVPKLRIPLQMAGGRLATVQQDSPDNVAACVYAILAYERGSRIEDPDFGIEDPTFDEFPFDVSEWLEQIALYEPRATIRTREEIEEEVGDILVAVGLRAG